MTYRVVITARAEQAILAQAQFIAQQRHAPLNAARWLDRVFESADTLDDWRDAAPWRRRTSRCRMKFES